MTPDITGARRSWPVIDHFPRRAWAWALGLGLTSAFGFQPFGLWPLALLGVGLVALLIARAETRKQALWLGWLFGWAHFTLGNSWIATAFTYQAQMPAILGWAAVPLLAIYLGLFPAVAGVAAKLVVRSGPGTGPNWAFALAFAGAWIITEWLRSWVFTGYPWNPLAMALLGPFDRPGLAALAPLTGTYALSGIAALLGMAVVLLAAERRWPVAMLVSVLLAAGMYWPASAPREGTLAVTIAHPNIPQPDIANPYRFEPNYRTLAALSAPAEGQGDAARLVLWPEAGLADYLRDGYPRRYYRSTAFENPELARRRIGRAIGERSVLLTGAVDLELGADETGFVPALRARNAVTALSADGAILAGYAKARLVPGGEYLPMRELLEPIGLSRLVAGSIDFWPGPGQRTLGLGDIGAVSPQVCYEIIFSGRVTDRGARPDYIFNPSSEGWFGADGPPQFLAQSRMRAIEEGLPVLRATNRGYSAVIDPRGVVRAFLRPDEAGRIDAVIPPAAPLTLFARLGNALGLIWAGLFILAAIVAMRRARG